jgi:hypothetical protein
VTLIERVIVIETVTQVEEEGQNEKEAERGWELAMAHSGVGVQVRVLL